MSAGLISRITTRALGTDFDAILLILTVKVSQLQEEHFHTEGRGKTMLGHNSAERLCTPPPMATDLPRYSNDLHTPPVSVWKQHQQNTGYSSVIKCTANSTNDKHLSQ